MVKKTPVSVYRLLSSPRNKRIVLLSSQKTPCRYIYFQERKKNKLGLSWAKLRLTNLELNWLSSDPLQTEEGPGGKWGDTDT